MCLSTPIAVSATLTQSLSSIGCKMVVQKMRETSVLTTFSQPFPLSVAFKKDVKWVKRQLNLSLAVHNILLQRLLLKKSSAILALTMNEGFSATVY